MNLKNVAFMVLVLSAWFSAAPSVHAAGTPISYQGSLDIAGAAANGLYDFRAVLYDSLEFGDQASPVLVIDDVDVVEGLVNLELDFGANAFNGDARFLQLEVRDGGGAGNYTLLQPRQEIFSVPNSLSTNSIGGEIIQHGTIGDCSIPNSIPASGSYTFPKPFASVPSVILTGDVSFNGFGCVSVRIDNKNATGFTYTSVGTDVVFPCDCIHWLAIGKP